MKNIKEAGYEIVARRHATLKDGRRGWTGVYRAAYSTDHTVIGFGSQSIKVPFAYQNGQVGSQGERDYAKHVTSDEISRSAS